MISRESVSEHILRTSEFRSIDDSDKALKQALLLIETTKISQQKAADICKIQRCRIQRALNAIKEGRKIGARGRPKLFNEEQENKIVGLVVAQAEENRTDLDDVKIMMTEYWTLEKDGYPINKIPTFSKTYIRDILDKHDIKRAKQIPVEPERVLDRDDIKEVCHLEDLTEEQANERQQCKRQRILPSAFSNNFTANIIPEKNRSRSKNRIFIK